MVSVAPRPTCFCKLFLIYELSVFIVMLQSVSKCRNVFMFYVLFSPFTADPITALHFAILA